MNKQVTLAIMAGGSGSRFGGSKQLQAVGPSGELLLEYAMFDAGATGFQRAVIIIRRDLEAEFKKKLSHWQGRFRSVFVFQDEAFLQTTGTGTGPGRRSKPWGTAHALLACRQEIHEPFAILNADDCYGRESLLAIRHYLSTTGGHGVLGFPVSATLSVQGAVSRAVLNRDGSGWLTSVAELRSVSKAPQGFIHDEESGRRLQADDLVSMNLWGFQPDIFPQLEAEFARFFAEHRLDEKSELPIPTAVNALCRKGISVRVIDASASDSWCGMTYRDDLESVRQALRQRHERGEYPTPLTR